MSEAPKSDVPATNHTPAGTNPVGIDSPQADGPASRSELRALSQKLDTLELNLTVPTPDNGNIAGRLAKLTELLPRLEKLERLMEVDALEVINLKKSLPFDTLAALRIADARLSHIEAHLQGSTAFQCCHHEEKADHQDLERAINKAVQGLINLGFDEARARATIRGAFGDKLMQQAFETARTLVVGDTALPADSGTAAALAEAGVKAGDEIEIVGADGLRATAIAAAPPSEVQFKKLEKSPVSDFPRRASIDQYVPAEKSIADAIEVVEAAGAHPLLTDAVVLLGKARDAVADWVESIPQAERPPTARPAPNEPAADDGALAFLQRAAQGECRIVGAGDLSELQLAEARAHSLMYVEPGGGLAWVLLPWDLNTAKDIARHDKRTKPAA